MARPLRIEFAGALYHITSRGGRHEAIYEDDEDREAFLSVLAEVVERYNWICHTFRLKTVEGNLSQGMRQLNGVYTQASQWHWSSYRAMMGQSQVPKWLAVDGLQSQFGAVSEEARQYYGEDAG